ncbi:hypothetical protein [Spiroplasma eriocheiris]|uniref:Uncharacterized protein n=1 Tax=Spiroplasma eriocheiris TaxID=315358 RepID=A0A0H3XL00_9MOLU|nr:hypothetical protein [Spiroplasma eriocheiris]AHF58196.1 hypothetical protein SPE_1081 [Spiroplasma eriocheiris CCTCC M 207170]AKM54631.1 hypothetical protein SERIO_v1c10780 [Spiroplasma eriocheiris]
MEKKKIIDSILAMTKNWKPIVIKIKHTYKTFIRKNIIDRFLEEIHQYPELSKYMKLFRILTVPKVKGSLYSDAWIINKQMKYFDFDFALQISCNNDVYRDDRTLLNFAKVLRQLIINKLKHYLTIILHNTHRWVLPKSIDDDILINNIKTYLQFVEKTEIPIEFINLQDQEVIKTIFNQYIGNPIIAEFNLKTQDKKNVYDRLISYMYDAQKNRALSNLKLIVKFNFIIQCLKLWYIKNEQYIHFKMSEHQIYNQCADLLLQYADQKLTRVEYATIILNNFCD